MISRLLKSLREYKKPAWLTMLVMIGEVVMEVLIPYKMADLIDIGFANGDMPYIVKTGIVLVLFALISLAFGTLGSFLGAKAATGFSKNLRSDMYRKVQEFSFTNIDRFSTSSIITRLTTDVARVQMAFGMSIRMAVRTPMTLAFSVAMTFFISWKIGLVMLGAVPVLAVIALLLARKVMPAFTRLFRSIDRLNTNVQENLHGIRVVKAFVRGDYEKKKFNATSERIYSDAYFAEKMMALTSPFIMGISYACMLIIAYLATYFIIGKEPVTVAIMGDVFTKGLLNSVLSYSMQILMSCMGLSMVFVMIMMSRESMRRIDEVLQEESTIADLEEAVREVKNGEIVFDDVDFSYAGDMKRLCLSDVNLRIPSGSTVGIIGGTGSSKSTLVQLIPRLYDVTGGRVLVGGTDVRDYDMKVLRDAVSVVLQKNTLFSGTIKDNLRWGNPDATDEEMERACRLASIDSFIQELPEKYNSRVEQGGTNFSGGQRQRLCIARALLKDPKILILDDSTSAVDTATDAKIQKAFREEIPDVTKIIIAQRISSVQNADMIIVMENGRIDEVGTHDGLVKTNRIYREVYESQQGGGERLGA
ncbi:MAG: ABC transporter ATP-binding protein [Lachnospiraceae bacterium]|nr:ABC transporter ATP-binding protein [Lachnospiraceae bacterium]